jgi:NADH pyrophosphatase NudC (nudix superfamily)
MKYCPECGNMLASKRIDGVERKACVFQECGFVHWGNPVPVVAALIEYQGKIVLARNSEWPEGMFSLVTGYLERAETPEEAVVREVKEELGLDGKVQEFIGCYSFIEKNQIILAHWVVATGELKIGNEISEVKLLSLEELELWQFGRLALTSAIAKQWLEKMAPNKALQGTPQKARRP